MEESRKMRTLTGHNARVPSLSWNGHVLSSGCLDGSIHHHDVRIPKHKVMELHGHTAEVSVAIIAASKLTSRSAA